jgi:hypothetical protein
MTTKQRETIETIRVNGGYACLVSAVPGYWMCAVLVDGPDAHYERVPPVLSKPVMNRLREQGIVRPAPGPGYGCCSFWEVATDP